MFQKRIREHYENLTPGFRKLADFIMNNTLDAAFLTAIEMAQVASLDPATVVRFSQELGYSGYRELSREIKEYVRMQITQTYQKVEAGEDNQALARDLMETSLKNIERFNTTEAASLAAAIDQLQHAARIWIAGEYTAYKLAEFIAGELQQAAIPATAFQPGMTETATILSQMQAGDALLALVLGNPGIDTGYAVKLAKRQGISTVCLSTSSTVLAAREADTVIVPPTKAELGLSNLIVPTMIATLLTEAVIKRHSEQAVEFFTERQSNMGELLSHRANTAGYEIPPVE